MTPSSTIQNLIYFLKKHSTFIRLFTAVSGTYTAYVLGIRMGFDPFSPLMWGTNLLWEASFNFGAALICAFFAVIFYNMLVEDLVKYFARLVNWSFGKNYPEREQRSEPSKMFYDGIVFLTVFSGFYYSFIIFVLMMIFVFVLRWFLAKSFGVSKDTVNALNNKKKGDEADIGFDVGLFSIAAAFLLLVAFVIGSSYARKLTNGALFSIHTEGKVVEGSIIAMGKMGIFVHEKVEESISFYPSESIMKISLAKK